MPRIARGRLDGFIYPVLNRGHDRRTVFRQNGDSLASIDLMGEAKQRHPVRVLAYGLMPHHFHLILFPQRGEDLSKFRQRLPTSHVRPYHGHYKSSGHVWQGRSKSFIVQKDEPLLRSTGSHLLLSLHSPRRMKMDVRGPYG
jgi:putative transposase